MGFGMSFHFQNVVLFQNVNLDMIAFPGDCHKYFMCLAKEGGGYDLQEFTCGDWVFDPNIDACTDPNLPSNDMLCPP